MREFLPDVDNVKLQAAFEIKKAYEDGELSLAAAKAELKNRVKVLHPYEVALIEQELKPEVEDECRKEDIQGMIALFEDVLDRTRPTLPLNHPILNYYRENDVMRDLLKQVEDLQQYPAIKNQWLEIYDRIVRWRLHLQRKQNQLYPVLEKKGFTRPTTTMWTLDDFIKDEISAAYNLLKKADVTSLNGGNGELSLMSEADETAFIKLQPTLVADILDLIQKEETVLYPTSLTLISSQEFDAMRQGDFEIGFANITPEPLSTPWEDGLQAGGVGAGGGAGAVASAEAAVGAGRPEPNGVATSQAAAGQSSNPNAAKVPGVTSNALASEIAALLGKYGYQSPEATGSQQELNVTNGKLTLEQINLIFQHMPVDFSYVDENEIVKFYNDSAHRVFPRSSNVIGRDVKNCHPRKSVHIVEEIISKFRSGEQDQAEFWINKPDIFIYILYTAVRDRDGRFRGVLEMMQDCTHIRSLTDSQTLLTWAAPKDEQGSQSDAAGISMESDASSTHGKAVQPAAPAESDSTKLAGSNAPAAERIEADRTGGEVKITPETFLKDLLAVDPELKAYLIELNPKFRALNTPLARIMLPKARVQDMSERTGIPLSELIGKLEAFFVRHKQ
ncbi:DUF438 domain-containing protein [Mageeibacillus indolicus]|uniref:DUF438 domain-containing protein n=1 Tax=Mageeibacillus indolicus TaxID=884684 RepID=UPI0004DCBFB8|nr:DUF438 domain-containing protein [Mageeibacillus indolicus]KFA57172.1 hypothetical protein HMPREF1632_04880 [Mageeibacillus indolicus 0009-5]